MTTDEWNALLNRLTEAWEHFTNTIQQASDALAKIFGNICDGEEKTVNGKTPFIRPYKKNQYLQNHIPTYRIERRIQKHLPYQRRNY